MDCKTDHTFLPFDLTHCPDCGEELKDEEFEHNYEEDCSAVEWDSWVLASAGMGTDEDYGYFGGDEY